LKLASKCCGADSPAACRRPGVNVWSLKFPLVFAFEICSARPNPNAVVSTTFAS